MPKAIECLNRALELAREAGDPRVQGHAHNGIGFFTKVKGETRGAIESFLQALQLFREAEDRGGEAAALNNLGQIHTEIGETRKAIGYFEQAAPLLPDLGDRRVEAALANNLGTIYFYVGEPRKSIEHYTRAMSLSRQLDDRNGEAIAFNNLGQIHAGLGDRQQALECYDRSLAVSRRIPNQRLEATTLNNIGNLYSDLGEPQKAIEYARRAGEIFRAVSDRFSEAHTLSNLGMMHTRMGQAATAIEILRQALALRQQTGDRRGEAYTRNHLGLAHHALGDERNAIEQYRLSLSLAQSVGDRQAEAYALGNLGGAHAALKDLEKARESYRQSLQIWRSLLGRQPEATTLGNLAGVERDLGEMDASREHFRAALDLIESMRTNLASQELRGSYFASAQNLHQLYIDLLVRLDNERPGKGFAAEALHASERARARGLMELLAEAHYEIKQGIDPALQQREQALHTRLSWLGAQLDRARAQPRPNQKQIATLAAELRQAESERQHLETEIRRGSPKYAELFYPEPPRLEEIQSLLDDRTALLEYAVGTERSYLFVVDREGLKYHRLPPAAEIERQVEELRGALLQTGRLGFGRYVRSARRLYETLIAPAAGALARKRNLIVIPEGKLHFLPFESLLASEAGAGGRADHRALDYLLKRWTVSYAPSAGVLAGLRQNGGHRCPAQHPVKQFIAFADPAYPPASDYKSLPDSSREAAGIAKLFRPDETAVYLRDEASEEKVKASEHLLCARRVHFAAHGEISESEPQHSALVLKAGGSPPEDGRLRTYEIFNLRLGADLVVLSACQTGMGKELKGEGVIGLARAFLYAGTSSAAVSLWQVPDRSTADLMIRFYQHLKQGGDKAGALRRAKLELIEAGYFANPHYWAPFVLIGESNQRR
jgi:CHAT domain-containing protein/Tfp pilus assembly protein PilF